MLISLQGKYNVYEFDSQNEADVISVQSEYFHVFRGRIQNTGASVIIKQIIDERLISGKEHVELLSHIFFNINELHKGIGQMLDVISTPQGVFLIREYVYGINLHTLSFDPDYPHLRHPVFLLHIAIQVCEILEVLHAHSIIHRNIKPSNIIIETNESGQVDIFNPRIKLVDFERAQITGNSLFSFPRLPFSVMYSPPELVLKQYDLITESIDMYGLGIALFESFARVPAFDSDNKDLVINMQISFPLKKKPNVPMKLFAIIQKATHKQVFKMPPSRLKQEDLRRFLKNAIDVRFKNSREMKLALELFLNEKTKKQSGVKLFQNISKAFQRKK